MPLLLEYWKPVVGSEANYEVSNCGNVRLTGGRYISLFNSEGYRLVWLRHPDRGRNHRVHCLVMRAFQGPSPDGHTVNHIDGLKANNYLSNLEYTTVAENIRHAIRMGLIVPKKKLTDDDVLQILDRLRRESPTDLAIEFGVSRGLISGIKHGREEIRKRIR